MRIRKYVLGFIMLATVGGLATLAFLTRERWQPLLSRSAQKDQDSEEEHHHEDRIKLSPHAVRNLGLKIEPLQLSTYTRTLPIPGRVVERRGRTDRGITTPVNGVVTRIHVGVGDPVKPGTRIATITPTSEYFQNLQSELYKTIQNIDISQQEQERIQSAIRTGALPETQLLTVQYQLKRLQSLRQTYRKSLEVFRLTNTQLNQIEQGKFLDELTVQVLPWVAEGTDRTPGTLASQDIQEQPHFEIEQLEVHLGERLKAGQVLAYVADHHALYIEGRAFLDEIHDIAEAATNKSTITLRYVEGEGVYWPKMKQQLRIRHFSNKIDPQSQTLAFYIPLENQHLERQHDGKLFHLWRFRPGQRVMLGVPIRVLDPEHKDRKVFVLPTAAVVREGAETYVFRQNGMVFHRAPVTVLHKDRTTVVLANDGSITEGSYVVQNAAAALNRALRAQSNTGGGHGHDHDHPH